MRYVMGAALILLLAVTAQAAVRTEVVEYRQGEAVLEGYLAYDDAVAGKRPGVMVVHEWWGINDFIKGRVETLAKMGYVAFAADIYGKGKRANHPEDAGKLAGIYRSDRSLWRARAKAGLDLLTRQPLVDTKMLAAIGYCFGGSTAIELALTGADLRGVASLHGGLNAIDQADAKNIKGTVLLLHGAEDAFVKPEEIAAFQSVLSKAGVDWYMVYFGGAVHSFTVPYADKYGIKGIAYNEKADRRSWEILKLFFEEIFKK